MENLNSLFGNKTNYKKVFVCSSYSTTHNLYGDKQVISKLENDIRCKLLGNVNSFLSAPKSSEEIFFPCNNSLRYIGSFFHETLCDSKNECEDILDAKISRLEESDLVIVILDSPSDVSTFSELLYATFLNKEIIIFANPNYFRLDKNYKGWYTFVLCHELNENITFINDTKIDTITRYLKNYKSTKHYPETPFASKKDKKIIKSEEIKLFFSATFGLNHKKVTKENIITLLEKNIRTNFLDIKDFAFESQDLYIEKNLKYIGGFYYHMLDLNKFGTGLKDYEILAKSMTNHIDKADVVTIILDQYTGIGVVQELLYASYKKKKVFVLYYPEITNLEDKTSEYWFPILLAQRINPEHFTMQALANEKDIIKYINYEFLNDLK